MAEQETEVMQNQSIIPATGDVHNVEESLRAGEKYLELMKRMRLLAIKLTNNLDWSNQGGKPYLEKSGCDKIASAFGVKIYEATFEKENIKDDKGEYVLYTCSAHGAWNNVEESEIGTCSSRDDFFGKISGGYKPLSEVDLTDVKKKAFTNLANRLIKKLLGLSFTWEEIKELSGGSVTAENVAKIEFSQGARGGNTDSPATKKLRDECRTWILKLCDGEEESAKKMLVEMTTFKGRDGNMVAGKANVALLSEKQIQILHGKLKEGIDKLEPEISNEKPH